MHIYYRGVEGICSILADAAVMKGGVESVCETHVSVMEHHATAVRGILSQENLQDEVIKQFLLLIQ